MIRRSTLAAGALALVALAAPNGASAQVSFDADFFKVTGGIPGFNNVSGNCCSGLQTGWVGSTLVGGLPTVTAAAVAYNGNNQILAQGGAETTAGQPLWWWTPNGTTIVADGAGTFAGATGFDTGDNFFASGQTNNGTFFRTAIFRATATNTGSGTWSVGGDDDTWVFRNGQLVLDNGGVKGFGTMTSQTVNWSTGDQITIFFADRNIVQSRLKFTATGLQTTVPEPSTYALMGAGLLGLAGVARHRRAQA